MDTHNQNPNTTWPSRQRNTIIRYGLCIALAVALLVGGALLTADRPSVAQPPQGTAPGGRPVAKSDRPSTTPDPGAEDFGAREAGLAEGLCRQKDAQLQTQRPDSSWVDRAVGGTGVDVRVSHPQGWTAEDMDGLGTSLAAPSGNLEVLVTASWGDAPDDMAEAMSLVLAQMPGFEVRSSGLVELSGVPGCHLVVGFDAGLLTTDAEMWVALPEGETLVLIVALSFGEATSSDWAAARGIAGTVAVEAWA